MTDQTPEVRAVLSWCEQVYDQEDIARAANGEGWMHDCSTKGRPVWWPWGVRCDFCGERL